VEVTDCGLLWGTVSAFSMKDWGRIRKPHNIWSQGPDLNPVPPEWYLLFVVICNFTFVFLYIETCLLLWYVIGNVIFLSYSFVIQPSVSNSSSTGIHRVHDNEFGWVLWFEACLNVKWTVQSILYNGPFSSIWNIPNKSAVCGQLLIESILNPSADSFTDTAN
jgi:hypothetical protein